MVGYWGIQKLNGTKDSFMMDQNKSTLTTNYGYNTEAIELFNILDNHSDKGISFCLSGAGLLSLYFYIFWRTRVNSS